jgi:hypothetical protein
MPVKELDLPSITKVTCAEEHYLHIPIHQISPTMDNDYGLEGHKSFMSPSKVQLSLHHIS